MRRTALITGHLSINTFLSLIINFFLPQKIIIINSMSKAQYDHGLVDVVCSVPGWCSGCWQSQPSPPHPDGSITAESQQGSSSSSSSNCVALSTTNSRSIASDFGFAARRQKMASVQLATLLMLVAVPQWVSVSLYSTYVHCSLTTFLVNHF